MAWVRTTRIQYRDTCHLVENNSFDLRLLIGFNEWRKLTRIVGRDCGRLREIAVWWILGRTLVKKIHGISSMWCHRVWFKTRSTWLDWTTINPLLSTSVIQICLQLRIRYASLWKTPSGFLRIWRWSHWSFWCRWSLKTTQMMSSGSVACQQEQ